MKPYLCPDGAFTALAARPPLLRPPRLLPTRFRRPILDFVGPPLLRASSHFRLKDYRISAELYEKSLLYLPRGIEDKTLHAKGFRVLCLCHLGLGQLDQAYEYIDEAQKFKVYLQRKDHDGAIAQMHALSSRADFTVDFLYLSVHEKCSLTTEGVH